MRIEYDGRNRRTKGLASFLAIIGAVILLVMCGFGCSTQCENESNNPYFVEGVCPQEKVNDYDWGALSKLSSAISDAPDYDFALNIARLYNLVNSDLKLDGTQTKDVALNNQMITKVMIIGFRQDVANADDTGLPEDSSELGITFMFQDALQEKGLNIVGDGFNDEILTLGEGAITSGSIFFSWLPIDLKQAIKAANKDYGDGLPHKVSLWVLSYEEITGIRPQLEGNEKEISADSLVQYKLFQDMNIDANGTNEILKMSFEGSPCPWWERSIANRVEGSCFAVSVDGNPSLTESSKERLGVVPAFCI